MIIVINFFIFQVAWFITVYAAAAGAPVYGPLFTLLWMVFHLRFATKQYIPEMSLLLFAATFGYLLDSLLVLVGMITFSQQAMLGWPSTLWMVALWINLAATINFSLKWLHKRLFVAALLGAIAGPGAYYAGSVLGAIQINGTRAFIAIAVQWCWAMPILIWFARNQSGYRFVLSLFVQPNRE